MIRILLRPRVLAVLLAAFCATVLLAPSASAQVFDPNDPIVGIQSAQNCQHTGLPSGTLTQGGVYCAAGGVGFSLKGILTGTIKLPVNNSQTPSYNIYNDTGGPLTTLTLYYFGALASNAFIDMQRRNPFQSGNWECTSVDANGVIRYDANCGTADISAVNPPLPLKLTWAMGPGGTAFPDGGTFNLWTASFAHSGQDAGYFSGPDGGMTIALLGLALAGMGVLRRRLR